MPASTRIAGSGKSIEGSLRNVPRGPSSIHSLSMASSNSNDLKQHAQFYATGLPTYPSQYAHQQELKWDRYLLKFFLLVSSQVIFSKKLSERLSISIQRLVEEKRLQGGFPVDSSSSEELLLEIYKVTVYCLIIRYYLPCLHTTDHFYDSSLFTESNHTTPGISSPTLDGQHKPFRKIGRHLSFHSTLSPKYITGSDA